MVRVYSFFKKVFLILVVCIVFCSFSELSFADVHNTKIDVIRTSEEFVSFLNKKITGEINEYISEFDFEEDLFLDPDFKKLFFQKIGKRGYSGLINNAEGYLVIHPNKDILRAHLSYLKDDFPEFHELFLRSINGEEFCEYYMWQDSDGEISQKYACVSQITIERNNYSVWTTSYLDDFYFLAEEDSSESFVLDVNYNFNIVYLTIFFLFLFFILFAFFSIHKTNRELLNNLNLFLLFSVLTAVVYILRASVFNLAVGAYLVKFTYIFLIFYFYYFMNLIFFLSKIKLKKWVSSIFHSVNILISLFILFSQKFIVRAFVDPKIYELHNIFSVEYGSLFFISFLVYIFYLFFTGLMIVKRYLYKKDKNLEYVMVVYFVFLVFALISIALQPVLSGYFVINPVLTVFFLFLVCTSAFILALFKLDYLKIKKNTLVLFTFLLIAVVILALIVFNKVNTEKLKQLEIDSKINANEIILEKDAVLLRNKFKELVHTLSIYSRESSQKEFDNQRYDELMKKLYDLNSDLAYGAYRINADNRIANSHTPIIGSDVGVDLSHQPHFSLIKQTLKPVLSDPFLATEGFTAVSLYVPIIKDGEYFSSVGYLIDLDRFLNRLFYESVTLLDYYYVVDSDDYIIYSIDRGDVGKNLEEVVSLSKGDILVTKEIEILDKSWLLINVESEEKILRGVMGHIRTQQIVLVIVSIFLVIGGLGFNLFLTKNLRKQIEKKTQEIQNINFALEQKMGETQEKNFELINLTDDLKKSMEKQKKLERIKTEFLSVTSHELRTPITPMKAQLQMVIQEYFGALNSDQKKSLNMVLDNTLRLDTLIGDILDVSKMESGNMKFVMAKTDFNKLINDAVENMKFKAEARNIKIVKKQNKVPSLFVDKDRITQVVLNLLSNAIKFSDVGSKINISVIKEKSFVTVKVKDKGVGISKEDSERIFRPFEQVDSTMSRNYEGTGLGLTICKGIIQNHGGEIWVESELNKGSTFIFRIPIKKKGEVKKGKSVELFKYDKKFVLKKFKEKIKHDDYVLVKSKEDILFEEKILDQDAQLRYDLSFEDLEKEGIIKKVK